MSFSMHSRSNSEGKSLIPIRPCVQSYAWGIRGMDSRVARYALESGAIGKIENDCPYAELWIGTHPKGPSTLGDGTSLEDALGGPLPFLFKVLSCGKTLSIQAHPDKELAAKLNECDPRNYGDANHKPEMAIALTPFEAMCGFRSIDEISELLRKYPEFADCISEDAKLQVFMCDTNDESSKRAALRSLFSSFMNCPQAVSTKQLKLLLERLQRLQRSRVLQEGSAWERKCCRAILRLANQFPGDAGAMAPFFLNYLLVAPGESFYMAPNEPHAYVAGEILECIACSDNVVRAGLTPKFKDVSNLVNMLTYSTGGPIIDVGTPAYPEKKFGMAEDRIMRYTPPVPEFEVMVLSCFPGENLTIPPLTIPAILVVIEGEGNALVDKTKTDKEMISLTMRPGSSYLMPCNCPSSVISVKETHLGPLKVVIAHENLHMHDPTSIIRPIQDDTSPSLTPIEKMRFVAESPTSVTHPSL